MLSAACRLSTDRRHVSVTSDDRRALLRPPLLLASLRRADRLPRRLVTCRETRAEYRAADLVRGLPRPGRRRRSLRRLLGENVVHRAAILSTARHPLCLRPGTRHAVDGGDLQPAGLRAGACRRAL